MGSIRKRKLKNGFTWVYCHRDENGRQHSKSLYTSDEKLAKAMKKDMNDQLLFQKRGFIEKLPTDIFLDAYWARYQKMVVIEKHPDTVKRENAAFKPFREYMGNIRLSQLTPIRIEDHILHRLQTVKASTWNSDLRSLHSAFSYAVKHQFVKNNPFKDFKQLPEEESTEDKNLTIEESTKLLDVIFKDDQFFYTIVLIYFGLGLRRQEALNIRWRDIDFPGDTITVYRLKRRKNKNRKDVLPLHPVLKEYLLRLPVSQDRVFNRSGSWVYHRLKKYYARAGLSKRFHVHTLRHTNFTETAALADNAFIVQ